MFETNVKERYIILSVILVLVIFFLIQIILFESNEKPGDYFPNTQMIKSFEGGLDNDEFTQIVDKIEGEKLQIRQIDNFTKMAMVYDISEDRVRLVFSLEEKSEFKEDYISDIEQNRDDIIIKGPLAIGTQWGDGMGGTYRITEKDTVVRTPAGEFSTIVISYKNDEFNVREYYARNIGLVKIVINNYLVNELVEIKIMD